MILQNECKETIFFFILLEDIRTYHLLAAMNIKISTVISFLIHLNYIYFKNICIAQIISLHYIKYRSICIFVYISFYDFRPLLGSVTY